MKEKGALDIQVGGSHYKDMKIQTAEFCQLNRFNHLESCAIKHIARHGKKGGRDGGLVDLQKAQHECQMIIDMEYLDLLKPKLPASLLPKDTMEKLSEFIPDRETTNALLFAIQRGDIPDIEWRRK